ncbi:MAG: mechanosensitive ion channel [bacterium]|nr:mechanosensitive ion channel [bacterium]
MIWQHTPKAIFIFVIFIGLYSLKFAMLIVYKKRNNIKGKDNFVIGVNTIYYLLLSAISLIFVLVLFRINVREFFTSISIIAAAIAILAKDYISNAINGMILMFNNQISINDYIQIGEQKGKISHISLLNVQLVNENDDLIFIPNNMVLGNEIINYTKGSSLKTSIQFSTDIKFISSIDELEIYLIENVVKVNEYAELEGFRLRIISVESTTITLKAEGKLNSKDRKHERLFRRQIINAWIKYINQYKKAV